MPPTEGDPECLTGTSRVRAEEPADFRRRGGRGRLGGNAEEPGSPENAGDSELGRTKRPIKHMRLRRCRRSRAERNKWRLRKHRRLRRFRIGYYLPKSISYILLKNVHKFL